MTTNLATIADGQLLARWNAAYGAAFADEMARGCHGQGATVYGKDGSSTIVPIDARARAHAWAKIVADASVEPL